MQTLTTQFTTVVLAKALTSLQFEAECNASSVTTDRQVVAVRIARAVAKLKVREIKSLTKKVNAELSLVLDVLETMEEHDAIRIIRAGKQTYVAVRSYTSSDLESAIDRFYEGLVDAKYNYKTKSIKKQLVKRNAYADDVHAPELDPTMPGAYAETQEYGDSYTQALNADYMEAQLAASSLEAEIAHVANRQQVRKVRISLDKQILVNRQTKTGQGERNTRRVETKRLHRNARQLAKLGVDPNRYIESVKTSRAQRELAAELKAANAEVSHMEHTGCFIATTDEELAAFAEKMRS